MQQGSLPVPPPPPPLLPPPPPPPPPPPGLTPSHHGPGFGRRRSRMRNFNWETLPKHSVIGKHNIWTADKTDGEYELDTDHMEELFSHNHNQQHGKVLNRPNVRGQPPSGPGGEMVSILSSKRSMNIGIFLKQFKRPVKDMIKAIISGSGLSFGHGKLRELCRLLPDEGEVKQLVGFKGDPSALPEADLFMLMLVKIPSYEERLSYLVLKEEFFPLMDEMKEFIGTLAAAGKELLECDNLHSVIRLVLKTGNYMNAGGYAGSAIGFRMSSLLKLADTKANKPGMNLMHYVVMQAQKADVALLKFPEQLKHIEAAARITKGDIEADYDKQVKKIQDAKANTSKQEELKAQMEGFLKKAEVCLADTGTDLEELQSISDSVAEYFCEDPRTFRLEECCSIFHSFCEKFMRAMQENRAREMAEIRRKCIDRLQNTAKRRSTATCSSRDKEMDGIALECVLQNFANHMLRKKDGRPTSTHGSPRSGSPTKGSLSEITSQLNLPSGDQKHRDIVRCKNICRKEWSSATKLTDTSSQEKAESHFENSKSKGGTTHDEEIKTSETEDSGSLTHPARVTTSITSTVRSFSATTEDDEGDVQDNNEEEAQKLREASKKVMQYQMSRGSASSMEYPVENPKSPAAKSRLSRQLTFDEETQRYPDDPTNDDLVRFLLSPQSSTKRNIGRRHTLPTKVLKTKKQEDNVQTQCTAINHSAQDKESQPGQDVGHMSSKQVFDFTDASQNLQESSGQDQSSPSAEKKSKLNNSSVQVSDGGILEQSQGNKLMESSGNNENIHSRSMRFKTENTGFFFSFLKRLGDMGKQQKSRETVHKGTDSSV